MDSSDLFDYQDFSSDDDIADPSYAPKVSRKRTLDVSTEPAVCAKSVFGEDRTSLKTIFTKDFYTAVEKVC